MIEQLKLRNFTAFDDLSIDFSPKINVIIGENATGKTHLLKAAYGICSANDKLKSSADVTQEDLSKAITTKFLRLFMPLDEKLGRIHRQGESENAQLEASFIFDKKISFSFHTNSKAVAIQTNQSYEQYSWEPVFIPTKEVLSFMKGFNSLYEKYELSFDQTYQDICLLLDLPEVRLDALPDKSKWAMAEIEKICDGRFIFYGGGKVTFKTENTEYSANAVAEGFRKAGILSRLLETGVIHPGVSGPLFWDEPEANLNPKLMKLLVEILLELSRNGQQCILATHDYVFLKWFDLLIDTGKEDHVQYHTLFHDTNTHKIKIFSTDDYLKIEPNPIDDAFGYLLNREIKNDMGDLGK